MAKIVVNPEAELPIRPGDTRLSEEFLSSLKLFATLKKSPAFSKFPGTCVLRSFRRNEVICRQGDPGGTAFYLLTDADVTTLMELGEETSQQLPIESMHQLRRLLQSVKPRSDQSIVGDEIQPRRLATARLMVDMKAGASTKAIGKKGQSAGGTSDRPTIIANDGPTDINYETRQAAIYEGEVFGEMSCLTRQPRSATIVADADCLALEFLRNILEQMRKDGAYNAAAEKKYRERVLEGHLRQLSIFRHLSTDEFKQIQDQIELVRFEPGTMICDEGDPSDAMYIVRSGIVQVVQSLQWRLKEESISDWSKFVSALQSGGDSRPIVDVIRKALPQEVQAKLDVAGQSPLEIERVVIVEALNNLAKTNVLLASKDAQTAMLDARMTRETTNFAPKVNSWTGLQIRRANRILFNILFPDSVMPPEPAGLARVMQYLGRGGVFGEIGVVKKVPRTASCMAYAHPQLDRETTDVEVVRIPAAMVEQIAALSTNVRAEIEKLISAREKQSAASSQLSVNLLSESRRAEELGLLQGQSLMLIDLDRCTRCGDCVQACISTHDDGHSRLFLDGPRFGKYLVPSSCRQCRDPVCMIGCPVGSIQQGDDGEIRIREWCIGCALCAEQCPYDSIQMHDAAMLPPGMPGWSWNDDSLVDYQSNWNQTAFNDGRWPIASTPFKWDLGMQLALAAKRAVDSGSARRLYFRIRFQNNRPSFGVTERTRLLLTSEGSQIEVFVNGQRVPLTQDAAQKKRFQHAYDFEPGVLRPYENLIAVCVLAPAEFDATVLDLRLDVLAPVTDEVEEKLVTEKAVVCDQCSKLSGGRSACVYACPHDAAFRVDAWVNLPVA